MSRATPPVVAGLLVALGGPALLAVASHRWVPEGQEVAANAAGQLVMWGLLGAVVLVALRFERQPLSSLGLRPLRAASLVWGLVAVVVLVYGVIPLATAVIDRLGLAGFEEGLSRVLALPLGLRVVAVATGGVVEEVLYRGYAITRLERLTGSGALAAALSVLAFALAHGPLWGPGPVVTFVFSGGFMAVFFLWRRDLLANIVAHAAVDSLGLILAPPAS